MNWIDTSVKNYYNWLHENTIIEKAKTTDWFLINTPFIGTFNDNIEIYARKDGAEVTLSDNGETLYNLELQGVNIQGSQKRRELLDKILLNYGIKELNNELIIKTDIKNFSQAKHNMLSAIIEINNFKA